MKVRLYILTIAIALAAVSASAQTTKTVELARFKPPFQYQPKAIVQLADGRIFGFYSGGYTGGVYQITRTGGAYQTTLVYEFGDSEEGPYDYYGRVDDVEAGSDGKIYYASSDKLWRFDPDAHTATVVHALAGNTTPTALTMGLDGHTLFGVMDDGHIYAFDTTANSYRDIADMDGSAIGVWQMKDGNLVVVHNYQSPGEVRVERVDAATGAEMGSFVQGRTTALPPTKGTDGEIYVQSRVFGDNRLQRLNPSCFCFEVLHTQLFPASPIFYTSAGPYNGKYLVGAENNPHWIDFTVTPARFVRLAVHQTMSEVLLPDGTLILSSFDDLAAIDLNTAGPDDRTTVVPITGERVNDGEDGFPSDYTEGADGKLYGVPESVPGRYAPIFRVDPITRSRALLQNIDIGDHVPNQGIASYPTKMVLASDGNLYFTINHQTGDSEIFRFNPSTNVAENVHSFPIDPNTGMPGPDGANPQRMTVGSDGWLYGVLGYVDDPNFLTGGIFKLDPTTGSFLLLARPTSEVGFYPSGPMVEARPGIWIGSYFSFGSSDPDVCSWLFRFDAATNTVTHLASLRMSVEGCTDGTARTLALGANGALYGMAGAGGAPAADPNDYTTYARGAFFTLDPDSGVVTQLHHYAFDDALQSPSGDLTAGVDGNLYAGYQISRQSDYEKGLLRFDPVSRATSLLVNFDQEGYFANALMLRDGRIAAGISSPWKLFATGVLDGIPVAPATAPFAGSTSVSATLKTIGKPMAGRSIAFTLNGHSIGSATTNAQGVATLTNVSVNGIAIGTFANAIGASFAGDDNFPATSGSGSLTVVDVPTPGLMTGDGFIRDDDNRYEFAFIVREKANGNDRGGFALRVIDTDKDNKGKNKKKSKPRDDRFVARSFTNVVFSDDPSIRPGRRNRPQVDTVLFAGPGDWNGRSGYRFEAFAQDLGEPGRHRESLRVTIYDSANRAVVSFDEVIDGGNVQSWRLRR